MPSNLLVFLPGRARLGAWGAALRKFGLQVVEGAEGQLRAIFEDRDGLLVTVAGWTPESVRPGSGRGKNRVVLPAPVVAALDDAARGPQGTEIEFAIIGADGRLSHKARVRSDRLGEPLAVGCRYTLEVPPPVEVAPGSPPQAGRDLA